MKKIIVLASVILMHLLANGQQTFQLAISGGGSDIGKAIIKTADGGYAITGSAFPVADSSNVYVIKLSSTGAIQWTKTYGGPNYDVGASIIQTSDHGYAITGRTGYWTFEVYTIKLDSNGVLQWTSKVNSGFDCQGYSVIQANDGGYIISGITDAQPNPSWQPYIIKLNSTGILQWTKSISGFGDGGYCIIQTNDGGYAVSGFSNTGGNTDLFIVKTDSSFNVQWSRSIGGSGQEVCFPATRFIQTADGGYAMTGYTTSIGAGGSDVYVVKLGSTGNLQWTRSVGGTGDDNGRSIIQTADKSYIIAGTTNSFGAGGYDDYVIKLDSSGVLQWTRAIGGTGDESANSLVKSNDGGYVIAGTTTTYGFAGAVYIVKLNASGNTCGNMVTAAGTSGSGGTAANGASTSSGYFGNGSTWGINTGSIGTLSTVCSCSPPAANITPSGSTTFCPGGNVVLNANTGTGLTYQWKLNTVNISGATNSIYTATTAGSYTVTVTNSCGAVTSTAISVTVNSLPSATITPAGPTTFCSGGSVVLNVPAGANKTYQWKKGANLISGATLSSYTATTGGNYRVIVTNTVTGCSKTSGSATVVTVNALPSATITPQGPTTFCAGGSVVLQANTGAGLTYKWKKGSNFISGATSSNYTATIGGNYRVQVTNSNGCSKTSALVAVSVPCKEVEGVNVGEGESVFDVNVYPNPNSGEFTIRFSNKPASPIQIELTDVIGKVVQKFETNDETIVIKESHLAKGIYCLTARNQDELVIKKINIVK